MRLTIPVCMDRMGLCMGHPLPEACVGRAVGVFFVEALSVGIVVNAARSASISDLSSLNPAIIRKSCSKGASRSEIFSLHIKHYRRIHPSECVQCSSQGFHLCVRALASSMPAVGLNKGQD